MDFFTLDNGLEVLFERQKGTKVCSIYLGIKTGSVNEPEKYSGISHFLEHLLFKGKATATKIESCGGYLNAYTSLDETVYYITLPSENFEIGLKEIKNLVFNPSFSEEEAEFEKSIILEELKGGKDNPFKLLFEKIFENSFQKIGYKRPVIGLEESIKSIDFNIINEYYRKNYSPKNSSLIIVGDVPRDTVKEKIKEIFSGIECYDDEIFKPDIYEPEKNNFKIIIENTNLSQYYLGISFKVPKFNSEEFVCLDVFSNFFGSGQSSHLVKKLKKEKALVLDIGSYIYPMKFGSIFLINAVFSKDKNPEKVIAEIFKEIEYFHKNDLSMSDIEKSILNLKSEIYFDKESSSEEAKKIVFYHLITGSYKNEKLYLNRLQKVNPLKIRKALKNWIDKNYSTIVLLSSEDLNLNLNLTKKVKKLKKYSKRELFSLSNGIKVIFEKIKRTPIIAYKIGAFGGLRFENERNNGINYILAKYLAKGTTNFSENEIFDRIESRGGELITFSGRNSIGIGGYFLKEEFLNSCEVIFDIVFNSTIPEDKLSKIKNEIIGKIRAEKDNPVEYTLKSFYKEIFKGHHYRFDIKGNEKNIQKFKAETIRKYYKKLFNPSNIIFSFAGDIDDMQISEILDYLESILFEDKMLVIPPKKLPAKVKSKVKIEKIDKNQAYIIVGYLAPEHGHKDSYAFNLIKNALGNQSGRLFNEIREKLGLCYSIFPFYLNGIDGGCFGVYVDTDKSLVDKVIKNLESLFNELVENGLKQEEIELARNYLLGNYRISRQKYISVAGNNLFNVLYGFGLDFEKKYLKKIKTLSKDEINSVIKKYFIQPKITMIFN